jgi:hypothetical protein
MSKIFLRHTLIKKYPWNDFRFVIIKIHILIVIKPLPRMFTLFVFVCFKWFRTDSMFCFSSSCCHFEYPSVFCITFIYARACSLYLFIYIYKHCTASPSLKYSITCIQIALTIIFWFKISILYLPIVSCTI